MHFQGHVIHSDPYLRDHYMSESKYYDWSGLLSQRPLRNYGPNCLQNGGLRAALELDHYFHAVMCIDEPKVLMQGYVRHRSEYCRP